MSNTNNFLHCSQSSIVIAYIKNIALTKRNCTTPIYSLLLPVAATGSSTPRGNFQGAKEGPCMPKPDM